MTGSCDAKQKAIAQEADRLASPYGIDAHVEKNFKDRQLSWLMTDSAYQKFVVQTGAGHSACPRRTSRGRCG